MLLPTIVEHPDGSLPKNRSFANKKDILTSISHDVLHVLSAISHDVRQNVSAIFHDALQNFSAVSHDALQNFSAILHDVLVPSTRIDEPNCLRRLLFTHQLVLNTCGHDQIDGHMCVVSNSSFSVWSTCSLALVGSLPFSNRRRHCVLCPLFATILLEL